MTKPTPIPQDIFQLNSLVAKMDTNIRTIKDDLIPPLAKDVREARDTALSARQSIDSHIADRGEHEHGDCDSKEAQNKAISEHDRAIAGIKPKISGLEKWRWWLMGIVVSTVVASVGFIVATKVGSAVVETNVENNSTKIQENSSDIHSLEKAQREDRETYLRTVKSIPGQVAKEASKEDDLSIDDIEEVARDLPLRPYEKRQLIELLKRARKRNNGDQ